MYAEFYVSSPTTINTHLFFEKEHYLEGDSVLIHLTEPIEVSLH